MKILGIGGSPRIGGNTDVLLDYALQGAKKGAEVEKVILGKLHFAPCLECEDMPNDGKCLINDDMQMLYQKISCCDAVILASPIFFGSLSAQTKMMIDRFQCLWLAKYIYKTHKAEKKRLGGFICVASTTKANFFENAKAIVKNFFATIDTIYKEEMFVSGVEKKGMILEHRDYLEKAFEMGRVISSF
ncbi:flavodoxin family protein [bacterium]|nr:flavodoxin family protein [bacterium]